MSAISFIITKKDKPHRISDWLMESVRESIFAGMLKPGDRIVEGKLAKELEIGICPVREALHRLEYLGLVRRYANKGTFVAKLTSKEITQIFKIRAELEILSLRFAIEEQEKSGLGRLQSYADQMMAASLEQNPAKFFEYDVEFHKQMCRMAKNLFLERCLLMLITPLFAFVLIRLKQEPILCDLVEISKEHQQIVDLFRSSNPDQAEQAMRCIMKDFREVLIKILYDAQLRVSPEGM